MKDKRPLLVFFCSVTSGPARRMESQLAHLARKERRRLRVVHVDVDRNPEVGQRFRISTIPTLVLVKERKVVGRIDGRASTPSIERMLEQHLPQAA